MALIVSYTSGLIAAFTPCVAVLFPLLLYRFFNKEKHQWKQFSYFILGYLVTYLIFSYILSLLLNSTIQNGFKVGLGIIFIVLGILSLINRLNPLDFPLIKNPIILGGVFAMLVSFNPCTLPYLGVILAMNHMILFFNLALFGLGVITPAFLFVIVGQNVLDFAKKRGKLFHHINKLMSIVLIASGIYMIYIVKSFGIPDVYAVAALMVIVLAVLLRSFFIINTKKDLLKISNILLIISIILLFSTVVWHCNKTISKHNSDNFLEDYVENLNGIDDESHEQCGFASETCEVCQRCVTFFGISALIAFVGLFMLRKKDS